jgi:hypothetical protein
MITTNSITYKDDFNLEDPQGKTPLDKNYLRILFNGGRSVQIRELNQIQSILQSQIDQFGSSIYKQGAAVIGGGCTFDHKINVITFDNAVLGIGETGGIVPTDIVRLLQSGGASTIAADVIDVSVSEDTTSFYIRYSSGGGGDTSAGVFNTQAAISLEAVPGGISDSKLPSGTDIVAGAFLSEGVFFVNGSFVVTPKQDLFIPVVDEINGVTGSVVLNVTESIVTYVTDQTLLDNAEGTPNHLAPGGDRYQVTLTLDFLASDAPADTVNRITLLNIVDSNIVVSSKSRYSDLDRQLAQRTSEESGNYILNPFKIEINDLLGSQRPGSTDNDAGDRVYIGLDPSVAYVDGYRIELGKKLDLSAPRARTFQEKRVSISLNFGNFVDVSLLSSTAIPLPNSVNVTYELKNVGNVTIGTCRIKSVESVGTNFRLFLYDIALTGTYNLANVNRIINTAGGINMKVESSVQDTSSDTSVFRLPYENVKSIAALSPEDFSYVIKKLYTGVVDSAGQFTINTGANETFEDASTSNFIVEVNTDWIEVGDVSLVSATSSSITIGGSWNPGESIKVIFPVRIESNTPATKTLTTITSEVIAPVSGRYKLSKADIFDVTTVLVNGTLTNITDDIEISSNGQKASHYTNGELRYTGTGTAPTISVTYRHFEHAGLPFTINSYPINWDENDALASNEIRYDDLPIHNGFSLGDAIDFRPTILAGAGSLTAIQPDPNSALTCKPTFFLSRVDKVVVNANGEFLIIPGEPAQSPSSPATPPASMTLYELYYPAYTYNASDVIIRLQDNRRYTMRDIARLDKRISNLEYYTSLSMLETSTNEKSIFDEVQGARFKNGMLIDSFNGHGIGNVFSNAYKCSIDRKAQTLRPFYYSDGVDLVLNRGAATQTGIKINENTITLDFVETSLISQLVSSESESVNPYEVATFVGNIKLFPTNDKWVESNRRPDIIVNDNSAFDAFAVLAEEEGILGTEWNAWETDWVGVDVTSESTTEWERTREWERRRRGGRRRRVTTDTTTSTTTTNTTTTTAQSREGTLTTLDSSVSTQNLGDRIVDISFVPFIRSREIFFHAKGLKPLTTVYPFFDGISVKSYCTNATAVKLSTDIDQVREYFNQIFNFNAVLKSDEFGELIGSFIIPNNQVLKFRVGDRVLKLTDSATNNSEEETTYAEGTYNASGTLQSIEATILSTRTPTLKRERLEESRVLVTTDTSTSTAVNRTVRRTRWKDPLAQTFIISDVAEGAFATSIDLWFTSKSTSSIPVSVYIVAVDNGYPSQRVLPFSEVSLNPNDVNIWTSGPDSQGATNFAFSDPVYLQGGVEYAIVVISNDPQYRIRVARLGAVGEDGKIIQTNPYGGVMFMSQNASTWTADQTRDIKFKINRAVFTPAEEGVVEFKTIMREGVKSISVTNPGTNYTAATVTIATPIPGSGVTATAKPIVDLVSGTIRSIQVTNPGSGYISNPIPNVTIIRNPPGPGTNAVAIAHMYEAPTSAFSLIQGAITHEKCELFNSLSFDSGSHLYQPIEAGRTYLPTDEFTITRLNRATLTSYLTTSSQYVTPMIDLDSMTLLSIHNQVNSLDANNTSEETADAGDAISRYISRETELNDPADQLNVYLDVNRPFDGANILLYVKLKYDSTNYSNWLPITPQVKIPINDDVSQYSEVSYIVNSASNDFIAFAIKLVFLSTSSVNVATAKNLRIIATS